MNSSRKERTVLRTAITRQCMKIQELKTTENVDVFDLESHELKLSDHLSRLGGLDSLVLEELEGEDLENEAATCDAYNTKIYDALAVIKVLKQQNRLSSLPAPQLSTAAPAAQNQVQLVTHIKLPELKLPQFDGARPSDYGAFKEQFENAVERQPGLSETAKL